MSESKQNYTIEIDQLTKRYDSIKALDAISFTVAPGEIVGFLGPNGAGKTTTLRVLTGILAPSSGTARIEGIDVTTHPLAVRRRIGYLPETVSLYPELRITEYLGFRCGLKGIAKSVRAQRIDHAMEQCRLTDVRRKTIGTLSKGYRQRVALADALLGKPKVLILDEPTVGLDPRQIRQTRELIMNLGKECTILLSTHILPEVEMLCDKVVIIHKGRIVTVDTPKQLQQKLSGLKQIRVQLKADAHEVQKQLESIPAVESVRMQGREDDFDVYLIETAGSDIREAVFQTAVKNHWPLRELAPERATLEDVFISLTHQDPQENA